jgi:hypothetical protein
MKLRCFVAAVLAAGLGLGCTHGSQSSPPRPGLDTLRAGLVEYDDLERKYLLTSFFRTLRPEDVPSVIAEVERHRVGFEADDVRLWMLAWTRFDGPGAFAMATNWPTHWRSTLMQETMWAWGYNDGRAAHAACKQVEVEEEDFRDKLCSNVIDGWVESRDGVGAAEYAATVTISRRRSRLAFRIIGNAKRYGPDTVIELVNGVPEDAPNDFKRAVFFHAGGVLARLDPERAASWYERHMMHSYSLGSLGNIATKWAVDHDAAAAIAWIEGLDLDASHKKERGEAIGNAFASWQAKAPGDARTWLTSIAPGPIRDRSIKQMAKAITHDSPAEAMYWVQQIDDDELRRRQMFRYTRRWFLQDPDGVKDWLAAADLDPDFKQGLVNNLPRLSEAKTGRRATGEKGKKKKKRRGRRGKSESKAKSIEPDE